MGGAIRRGLEMNGEGRPWRIVVTRHGENAGDVIDWQR
jgi:hypothetical protein